MIWLWLAATLTAIVFVLFMVVEVADRAVEVDDEDGLCCEDYELADSC